MSNKISMNIRCPSCSGDLQPAVLICNTCSIEIKGEFIKNEFNSLTPDELHFLRVFIQCEGKIGDMESSLGVSYPTVKAHLAALKKKLNLAGQFSFDSNSSPRNVTDSQPNSENEKHSILSRLEKGEIDFEAAIQALKAIQKEKGK